VLSNSIAHDVFIAHSARFRLLRIGPNTTGRLTDTLLGIEHLIIDRQQPTIGATLDVQQRFAEECPALP
jgi:hypothetical protein